MQLRIFVLDDILQIVYSDESWRNILNCWRRVGQICWCFRGSIKAFKKFVMMFFKKGLKTDVTHCTIYATRWLSIFPRAMTRKNAMSLMSFEFPKWHQWHEKNKHIARGCVDIQWFMILMQWVQWDFESKFHFNGGFLFKETITSYSRQCIAYEIIEWTMQWEI